MTSSPVNIALDVSYADDIAFAAGIGFACWDDAQPAEIFTLELPGAGNYVPGNFYLRELPSLVELLARFPRHIATIVIDGYVTLDADSRPGLGFHLWERLDRAIPVIGVAKTRYPGTPDASTLWRGRSKRPLYVTATGLGLHEAKAMITRMHGPHRLPTLLKLADTVARSRQHVGV